MICSIIAVTAIMTISYNLEKQGGAKLYQAQVSYTIKSVALVSRGTRAQHLTLSVWCVCDVWCPLDGCNALIRQRDNCTVTVSVYSACVHTTMGTT